MRHDHGMVVLHGHVVKSPIGKALAKKPELPKLDELGSHKTSPTGSQQLSLLAMPTMAELMVRQEVSRRGKV